jgi:hypothetical protein
MKPVSAPWSPADVEQLRAGSDGALTHALATLLRTWCGHAGADFHDMKLPSAALAAASGPQQGLLLAAHDLMTLLANSPEGRKALADFDLQPLFQQVDRERRAGS